ncbi:hypothetical protein [Shewanella baltica]|uniref:hypothetical protein n=1 Tax=Shewanella baltica TaxID=62322 RepID=UPI0039B04153
MSWSHCGEDSNSRPIGYAFAATCDHPGCHKQIDRGLSYACGSMHGEDEISCEGYFCEAHRPTFVEHCGRIHQICSQCTKALIDSGEWQEDENEGCLRQVQHV